MQSVIPRFESAPDICAEVEQLAELGLLEQAETVALEYLETDSRCGEILAQLSAIKFVQEEYEIALDYINRARKLEPSNLSLILLKAEILSASGDFSSAVDAAAIGATLFEENADVHGLLGRLWMCKALSEEGDERKSSLVLARQYCTRAFELGAANLGLYLEAASINLLQGHRVEAEDNLYAALAIEPYDPLANFLIGELAFSNKEWAKAESYLAECALDESPWQEEARQLLKKVRSNGFNTIEEPRGVVYRLAVAAGGIVLACLLAVVPTLFFWIAVDSFTGYFPPMDLALLSVPIAPLAIYLFHESYSRYKTVKSRRQILDFGLSNVTQEYVRRPYSSRSTSKQAAA